MLFVSIGDDHVHLGEHAAVAEQRESQLARANLVHFLVVVGH